MAKLKIALVIGLCCLLSGCFQIEGVYVLHYYGESDTGSYRLTMNQLTYTVLTSDKTYAEMYNDLKRRRLGTGVAQFTRFVGYGPLSSVRQAKS